MRRNVRPALHAIHLFDEWWDMMQLDVFLFTICCSQCAQCVFRKGNIYLHPSCLCLLSLRTGLHVNTTNPQVRFKCRFSSVRIGVNLFSYIKWSVWYLSPFVIPLQLCNKCINMFHGKTSHIRVGMYTVMSNLLNDVVATPVPWSGLCLLSDKLNFCFACNNNSWSTFCTISDKHTHS